MESAAKVLVLLTGMVVALGFDRIFSSAERTREAPAYRSLFTENVLASLLWVVTAFRSCSPVPVRKAEEPHRWEMWLQAQPQVSTRGPWRDLTPGTS